MPPQVGQVCPPPMPFGRAAILADFLGPRARRAANFWRAVNPRIRQARTREAIKIAWNDIRGYTAAFRRICQSREGFARPAIIGPPRWTSSRSIRSSPRRVSRARWSTSALGALILHKSPLIMLPPQRGCIRARLGVTLYVICRGRGDV